MLITLLAGAALAQATTPAPAPAKPATTTTTATKPVVHHTVAKPVACVEPPPVTPAGLPPAVGKVKTLYKAELRYVDVAVGAGDLAPDHGWFTVKYTGWLAADGKKFDSSNDHPGAEPITFPVGAHRVIPGWDTGFTGMHIGGKRRLFIPYELAYGDTGRPPTIPAKADLIFDLELISVSDKAPEQKPRPMPPPPPAKPGDASAPQAQPAVPTPGAAPAPPPPPPAPAVQATPQADHATPQDDHATPQTTPKSQ